MEINIKLLKIQNQWWDSGHLKYDPVILSLETQPLEYRPKIIDKIDLESDKISLIQGAKGLGKTTVIKLLIVQLIKKKKVDPQNILYYSCHNLNSKEQLNEIVKTFIYWRRQQEKYKGKLYIFIDEISLLKNWEKGIGYLREAGILNNIKIVATTSTYYAIKKDSKIKWNNVKINALSFSEILSTLDSNLFKKLKKSRLIFEKHKDRLEYYLNIYFLTGGYISAINSFLKDGAVKQDIYDSYLYWLITDVARTNKDLVLFRQIIEQVINLQGQAFGFKSLTRKTKARTHNTVADYIGMLQTMFIVQASYQSSVNQGIKRSAAKKICFRDPFIFWVFYAYLYGSLNYWQFSREYIHEGDIFQHLLNNVVFSHLLKKENLDNWEQSLSFFRDAKSKSYIPFIDTSSKRHMPIIMRYNKKIDKTDIDIFEQLGFNEGIIISRNILDEKKKIKIMPLTYFLLYY